jgi:predicted nucleotidyltransferase
MRGNSMYDISLAKKIYEEKCLAEEDARKTLLKNTVKKLTGYFSDINIKSVYITGSLIKEHCFKNFSDIDIAVEGLDKNKYWDIYGDLEHILETERIDLIELEKCRFKDSIRKEGFKIK